MTITEALAEIKTIMARLEKKSNAIGTYVIRDARLKDPLEREGGSVEFIRRERQALTDLQLRRIALRTAIQRSNLETKTTIGGVERTVADWLTWRREIAQWHSQFLNQLVQGIKGIREKAMRDGRTLRSATSASQTEAADPMELFVNLDERGLLEEVEKHETTLGELDGRLSLLNATTHITI